MCMWIVESLELDWQAESWLTWALRTELGSTARAIHTLNH